jgi:hypothetical protein
MRQNLLERSFHEVIAELCWCKRVSSDTSWCLTPTLTLRGDFVLLELGLGVRADKVEQLVARCMCLEDVHCSSTVGVNLSRLVGLTGWQCAVNEVDTAFAEILRTFDSQGVALLSQYRSFGDFYNLAILRLASIRHDPFLFREHHYIPAILILNGERQRAADYLDLKIEALALRASDQFLTNYREFAKRLLALKLGAETDQD